MTHSPHLSVYTDKAPENDDRALVAQMKTDPNTFEELYRRHVQAVYRYFFNRTHSQNEAEDLTTQTFLAALEALPHYNDHGTFVAWLFSIARRKAADHFRANARQSPQALPDDIAVDSDFLNDVIRTERLQHMAAIFRALPKKDQELIRLRYVAELSFAEMGHVLHRSEGAVKKAVYRIIDRMRKQLEENYE
ncbi:MAG: RNA polymerase sigma factor [Chloroflexi bacterium]|jgi:RNA polymerase sigma-70 factor (ECF subfamily)|nr:RNA polymerase sigma factor [Chloroflexota bacterium]